MRGKVLFRVTEWENPTHGRNRFEVEIFPYNGEIIATSATLLGIVKKLMTQKVMNRINKERD